MTGSAIWLTLSTSIFYYFANCKLYFNVNNKFYPTIALENIRLPVIYFFVSLGNVLRWSLIRWSGMMRTKKTVESKSSLVIFYIIAKWIKRRNNKSHLDHLPVLTAVMKDNNRKPCVIYVWPKPSEYETFMAETPHCAWWISVDYFLWCFSRPPTNKS